MSAFQSPSAILTPGSRVLFQGDSITDCGREREREGFEGSLGGGYVLHIAAQLAADRPGDQIRVINRGIGGNRVVDLYARWKRDTLALAPDVLSILIGVNDTWHEKARGDGVEPERYESVYRDLLSWTKASLPHVRLVLCEPFVLPCGVVQDDWIDEMNARREIVARLAADFGAVRVPFQSLFDRLSTVAPPAHWAEDGVHPSPAGHLTMARQWIESVEAAAGV